MWVLVGIVQSRFLVRTSVPVFFAMVLAAASPMKAAADDSQATAMWVKGLIDKITVRLWQTGLTSEEREAAARDLLDRHTYLDGVARYVIGRYWRRLEEPQRAEYLAAFKNYIVGRYLPSFVPGSAPKIEVIESKNRKKDFWVTSWVRRDEKEGEDYRVDWRVRKLDSDWRLTDVRIQGISFVVTQRSEFASILRPGDVAALMEALRQEWADYKAGLPK